MSSSHKTLWSLLTLGRLQCQKKDPSKTRFQIPGWKAKTGFVVVYEWVDLRSRRIPTKLIEDYIVRSLEEMKRLETQDFIYYDKIIIARDHLPLYEEALDYYYMELGRRAARKKPYD